MEWTIDTHHTSAGFSVKHMAITTVRGQFGKIAGTVEVEDGKLRSANLDIDVSSVDTHDSDRDAHLRSGDFFDIENHPHMHFTSTTVDHVQGEDYRLSGNLTIRGVTKPLTLEATISEPLTDPWGNERIGVSASGKINRKDWDLTWNRVLEAGSLLVGEDVKIEVDMQAFRTQA